MKKELLTIEDGEIDIRGNKIFTDLYLQLYKSEILGIVFDNAIERKCLLELFKGEIKFSGGRVYIGNKKNDYDTMLTFFKNNTTVIEKKSKLIDNLTIEENVFLFVDRCNLVSARKYKKSIIILADKFGLDIDITRPIRMLSEKERILIELLKAYYEDKKLVILHYLSGRLQNNDLDYIHQLLLKLTNHGMTFILIEAYNNVVFEWVNRFYLFRQGKTTGIIDSNTYNNRQLYSILTKKTRSLAGTFINKNVNDKKILINTPVFEMKNIYTNYIKDLSLKVMAGEILNIIYMDDESCEQIIDLLKGNIKPLTGDITLLGRNIDIKGISHALNKGICYMEESPYENMLFYNMTLRENLGIALSNKVPFFWIKKRYIKSLDKIISTFDLEKYADIKLRKLDPRILQTIAYLKWYLYAPNIVICIRPFTELDITLQEITIQMIEYLKSRNISVILLTPLLTKTHNLMAESIYIKDGKLIDKNQVYINLYKKQ